jgi:hypothetical protein
MERGVAVMGYTNPQPNDSATIPISSGYSPQNNTFPAMQGADGAYLDAFGNMSSAPVMSFIQPRVAQRNYALTGAGSNILQCTFNAPNIGGNSIVVCIGVGDMEDSVTSFKVTDTQGNTYTKVASQNQGSTLESAIYLATGIKSGLGSNPTSLPLTSPVLNTITIAITGPTAVPTGISMKIYEVWGLIASVDALDQVDLGNGASGLVASTTSINPSVPNTIAFTSLTVGNVTTISPATTWSTNDGTLFPWGGNLGSFDSQYRPLSTLNPLTPQANLSLSSPWAMCSATFRSIIVPVAGVFQLAGILANLAQANQIPVSNASPQGPLTVNGKLVAGQDNLITFNGVARRLRIQNESSGFIYWRTDAVATADSPSLSPPASNAVIVEWLSVQCTTLHIFIPKSGTTLLNKSGGVKVEAYA